MTLADGIGWTATAVFTASYLTRGPSRLRRVQMAGASLWLTYGLVTQAAPVIGSNVLVLGAALWAEHRSRRDRQETLAAPPPTVRAMTADAEAA
jgi:hypothetical protein